MPPDENPYVGPRPFEAGDARFFFARDAEVEALAGLVLSSQVVLLYAASGAGKSSLINAALIPRLEHGEQFEVLPVARVRAAGTDVPEAANVFVAAVASHLGRQRPASEPLHAHLSAGPRSEAEDGFPAPRLLVIDQFEELFTAYPERWADRPGFFDELAKALRADPLLRIVLAIREDFVAQLSPFTRLLPDGLRTRYRLERLTRDAAVRAISEPARVAGRPFAAHTAEQLVDDLRTVRLDTESGTREVLDEFVEPVQLQVVAHQLWEALPASATEITEEHRERFGDVDEVLRGFYDDAIAAATTAARISEDSLRAHFAETFITPMGTRGTVVWTRSGAGTVPDRAVSELDARHLIRAEHRAGARWYELTHDRLIDPIRASNRERERQRSERRRRAAMVAGGLLVGVATAAVVAAFVWSSGGNGSTAGISTVVHVVTKTHVITVEHVVTKASTTVQWQAQRSADVGSIRSITYTDGGRAVLVVGTTATTTFDASRLRQLETGPSLLPTGWQRWAAVERGGVKLEEFLPPGSVRGGRLVLSGRELNTGHGPTAGPTLDSIALSDQAHYAAVADVSGTVTVIDTRPRARRPLPYPPPPRMSYATPAFGANVGTVLFLRSDGTITRASTTRKASQNLVELQSQPQGIAVDAAGGLIAAYGDRMPVELLDGRGRRVGGLPAEDVVAAAFSPSGDRLALGHQDGTIDVWPTGANLVFGEAWVQPGSSHATVIAFVRNNGASRSAATMLRVGAALRTVAPVDAGKVARIEVEIGAPQPSLPILIRIDPLPEEERPGIDTALYVWAPGDRGAQVVAAAQTAALHPTEIEYATLQPLAFQGILDDVRLPGIPSSANSVMFATWCYWQARVADPNGDSYESAYLETPDKKGGLLHTGRTRTSAPQPGDLVFYKADASTAIDVGSGRPAYATTAIYVGSGSVVRWGANGHPKRTPLGRYVQIRTYPMARVYSAACTRPDCRAR